MTALLYQDIIAAKKAGRPLSCAAIDHFVTAVAERTWPQAQIAALLMAIRCRGMTPQETLWLTQSMARHSQRISPPNAQTSVVDKHSTGGVGDGISLVLAPLAASLGLCVPMMSGRSLGLTGGTLDKLDSIPGLRTLLTKEEVDQQLRRVPLAMFGQSRDLAPVDRELYALRDTIGAVDSLPLIVASIVSKKLTEGLQALVFDVKFGRGAIFSSKNKAVELARALVRVSRAAGLKAKSVLTAMEEPLGRAIGNTLEMAQAWALLSGGAAQINYPWFLGSTLQESAYAVDDYMEVTHELLFQMLFLSGKVKHRAQSREMAFESLRDGRALQCFKNMLQAQGVVSRVTDNLISCLPQANRVWVFPSPKQGWISFVDAQKAAQGLGFLGGLRCGERESIDLTAGIWLLRKSGEFVRRGEPLAELHSSVAGAPQQRQAQDLLASAYRFSTRKPPKKAVVRGVL